MAKPAAYDARVLTSWADVPHEWHDRGCAPTPFQTAEFLSSWYETFGAASGYDPVIVEVRSGGQRVALWPLVRKICKGLREIGFADEELTDNAGPLMGPAFPLDADAFAAMWRTVMRALPPADVLRFEKLHETVNDCPNPVAQLSGRHPAPLTRHVIRLTDNLDDYFATRTTKFNKEQRRVWRVFLRNDGAEFEMVRDPARAMTFFAQMETLQQDRMREIGVPYRLGDPRYREFFRRLVGRGVATGAVRFAALTAGEQLIGGLLGVSNGNAEAFVRICHAPGHWSACSPGRLVLEKAIETMHAEGRREIDLSVGDFPYKYDFSVQTEPLANVVSPLSWRGRPLCMGVAFRQRLKRSPLIQGLRRRFVRTKSAPDAGGNVEPI